MSHTETADQSLVTVDIFFIKKVQQTATLVDQGNKSTTGRVVLRVSLQMRGKVGNSFRQAGNLVFGAASVLIVSAVLFTQFLHALLRCSPGRRLAIVFYANSFFIVSFQVANIDNVVISRGAVNVREFFFIDGICSDGCESLCLCNLMITMGGNGCEMIVSVETTSMPAVPLVSVPELNFLLRGKSRLSCSILDFPFRRS